MRTINLIVIHCSATREDKSFTEYDLDVCHRRRGFNGAGYHFYIRKNGDIKSTRPIERIGAHSRGFNKESIGICYEGGLDCKGQPKDTGLTLSRMRKRISEIGVRKAFGAPRRELMMQVLSENMLYSLFGGILGLVLSYVAAFLLGGMLFSVDFVSNGVEDLRTMCVDLLFDPTVFLLAFLACFLLNLLSAAIPAWRVTRTNIVDAINER